MADIRVRVRPEEYAQVEAAAAAENLRVGTFARRELLHPTRRSATLLLLQGRVWFIDAHIMALEDEKTLAEKKLERARDKLTSQRSAHLRHYYQEEVRDYETTVAMKAGRIAELVAEKAALITQAESLTLQ